MSLKFLLFKQPNNISLNGTLKAERILSNTLYTDSIEIDNNQGSSNKITLTGDGSATVGIKGSESFTLTFNGLTTTDTLSYYCTSHSNMVFNFQLE